MSNKNGCIVVAGCSRLGAGIAGKLSEDMKDVIVVDNDKKAFRKLPYSYGGITVTGSITDIDKMSDSNIVNASVFIAVTNSDSINICASQIAKEMFGIPKVISRIYDEDKVDLLKNMGIETICPSRLSREEINHYIGE